MEIVQKMILNAHLNSTWVSKCSGSPVWQFQYVLPAYHSAIAAMLHVND